MYALASLPVSVSHESAYKIDTLGKTDRGEQGKIHWKERLS
jgi:hypothetical protein